MQTPGCKREPGGESGAVGGGSGQRDRHRHKSHRHLGGTGDQGSWEWMSPRMKSHRGRKGAETEA